MQKKTKKALSVGTIASLLVTSSVVSVNVKAAAATASENPRLWGSDRYETAAKVAQTGWTSTSDYAVIASGEGYADALCAAPLAKANNAPILLTQNGDLNANTLSELKRLNVKHAFIVGGTGVVSQNVEDKIKAQVGDVQRLAGQNRYETSVKVAEKLGTTSKIVLASGEGYADALSAAPVAAIEGMPILLTQSNTLSTATAEYIKANTGITKTYVIGGYASVSDAAMNSAPGAERIYGSDRYATNAAVINKFASDFNFNKAYFALGNGPTGNEFADALTGSALAAKDKAPLIIVGKELSDSTKELIKTRLTKNTTITVLGGTANIADSLVSDIVISAGTGTTIPGGGSGGGSSSSSATYLNTTSSAIGTVSGPAYITTAGVSLSNGTINGDLYVNADSVTLSNITVTGEIHLNPGSSGSVTLDSVTAKSNVIVESGATNSIHVKGKTTVVKLIISAVNNNGQDIRIVVEGTSEGTPAIAETEVKSKAILKVDAGSFGTITIPEALTGQTVELIGTFKNPIIVKGNVELKTDSSTSIPAIIVSEGVNANGINITGSGTIVNIQVRSESVVLNIAGTMVVTGNVEAVKDGTVKPGNPALVIVIKVIGQMTDITGTTSTDFTSLIATVYASKIQSYLSSHLTLDKYLDVNTAGSSINLTITKNWTKLSDLLTSVQGEDPAKLKTRISAFDDLLGMPFVSNMKIGNDTVVGYLNQVYPNYFNTSGSSIILNQSEVYDKILGGQLNYSDLRTNLITKIKQQNTSNVGPAISFVLAPATTTSSETKIDVDKIVKDGKIIYDKNASEDKNLEFLSYDNISDFVGTYTIYSGSNLIKVTVTQ